MKYVGKLYGKIGRKHIPMLLTSDDVDRIEMERDEARKQLKEARECLKMAMYGPLCPESPNPHGWVDGDLWNRWRIAAGLKHEQETS